MQESTLSIETFVADFEKIKTATIELVFPGIFNETPADSKTISEKTLLFYQETTGLILKLSETGNMQLVKSAYLEVTSYINEINNLLRDAILTEPDKQDAKHVLAFTSKLPLFLKEGIFEYGSKELINNIFPYSNNFQQTPRFSPFNPDGHMIQKLNDDLLKYFPGLSIQATLMDIAEELKYCDMYRKMYIQRKKIAPNWVAAASLWENDLREKYDVPIEDYDSFELRMKKRAFALISRGLNPPLGNFAGDLNNYAGNFLFQNSESDLSEMQLNHLLNGLADGSALAMFLPTLQKDANPSKNADITVPLTASMKLQWKGQKNQLYHVLRQLKVDHELIGNSFNSLADFLKQNVTGFENSSKETIEKELKRKELPHKEKRVNINPNETD